uniref:RH2 domain-containing protein n=1 Tax=Steinernema glaseri TaxID=37863 RepID=A0A1I7YM53_9BILA
MRSEGNAAIPSESGKDGKDCWLRKKMAENDHLRAFNEELLERLKELERVFLSDRERHDRERAELALRVEALEKAVERKTTPAVPEEVALDSLESISSASTLSEVPFLSCTLFTPSLPRTPNRARRPFAALASPKSISSVRNLLPAQSSSCDTIVLFFSTLRIFYLVDDAPDRPGCSLQVSQASRPGAYARKQHRARLGHTYVLAMPSDDEEEERRLREGNVFPDEEEESQCISKWSPQSISLKSERYLIPRLALSSLPCPPFLASFGAEINVVPAYVVDPLT